ITGADIKQQLVRMVTALNPRIDYYIQVYEPGKHAIDLHSPKTTIQILTPLPLEIAAGTQGLVQIKVRYKTETSAGTVELREGYDYIKRYENNIAPNPNAKVIAHGIGKYKGEQDATFEIRIVI
ncbi:MAG: hypothetical protein LBE71_01885, partial [Dysgonamonadaceae bacterium]|nr:hypothetical protein [Dysgonamonadaceae bacterium]